MALVPVTIYPLMKRITYWPQLVLGFAFNWGALLGWPAVTGTGISNWNVTLPLYAAGICWTLVYDTIYAHQDKRDDVKAGVKSTALLFGSNTKPWLILFTGLSFACMLVASDQMPGNDDCVYFIPSLVLATASLANHVFRVKLDDPKDCLARFKKCQWFGVICTAGIYLDVLLSKQEK